MLFSPTKFIGRCEFLRNALNSRNDVLKDQN